MKAESERARAIASMLQRTPLRIGSEALLQQDIAAALERGSLAAEREVRLSAGDRPDFMCGGIAIEAKVKCSKRVIYAQLARYAMHDAVAALILVTGTALGLPPTINGKPVYLVSIGRAFL